MADARVSLKTGARRKGGRRVRVHGRRVDSRPWVGRGRRGAPAGRMPRVPAPGAGITIGDVAGDPMLARKASHEARVAVEAIHGKSSIFEPRAIPAVAFTDRRSRGRG